MNYQLKNFLYRVFSLPILNPIYYKIIHLIKKPYLEIDEVMLFHERNIKKYNATVALEIGAGQSLYQNIYLSKFLKYQYLYDIERMASLRYINFSLKKEKLNKIKNINELKSYNIEYNAPFDILNVKSVNDVNFFLSSSTFEHIPKNDLIKILIHIKKIIFKNSYLSLHIDYSDHLSHRDKNFGRNHFLTFSNEEFKKYNSKLLYQNRLRHEHYKQLFISNGYKIIEEKGMNYHKPKCKLNKELLTGNDSDFFTTGRWVLRT